MNDNTVTVLVVDDEPRVLALTARHLHRNGYTALTAAGGDEALTLLESGEGVALVLTDCNMPGLSGPQLDKIILMRWPHIKVVAMSGRPRSPELPDQIEFLPKPFRSASLIAVVESVLNHEAA